MVVESCVTQEEIKKEPEKPIDREKTCPLLLRVFTTNYGRHHRMHEFSRGNVPSCELQIYTWMDATLKELTRYHSLGPDASIYGLQLLLKDKFYHVIDDNPPRQMLLFTYRWLLVFSPK
ncbi:hypothetical protein EI555_008338 [Monodon monoceros]|uniref:18 kDa Sin3-associated polypeptide n=1 Tax=Monodon monoceros TaxID=40151 RepID=A0A4U1F5W2_MONMO|nr:hypothetical protein EI555_008338 [Monodon monoceros]